MIKARLQEFSGSEEYQYMMNRFDDIIAETRAEAFDAIDGEDMEAAKKAKDKHEHQQELIDGWNTHLKQLIQESR